MDNLKDIWASIVAHVNERTTNPLSFSFAASWAAWNYRFLVLLFSEESPAKTFAQIDVIYASGWTRLISGFLAPLATALAYVYVYPYVTQKVVRFYRARQIAIANAIKQEEGNRLMRPDEVSQIVRLHESDLRAAREELTASQTRVAQLRDALAVLDKQNQKEPVQGAPEGATTEDSSAETPSPDGPASPEPAEEVIHTIAGPKGRLIPLYRRHLAVLTAISESKALAYQVAESTKLRKYWADESLRDLVLLGFAEQSSTGYYESTPLGLSYLRNTIAEGKWHVSTDIES